MGFHFVSYLINSQQLLLAPIVCPSTALYFIFSSYMFISIVNAFVTFFIGYSEFPCIFKQLQYWPLNHI